MASLSLHHVADLDQVLDRLGAVVASGGVLVVVEWAWERFDEATARWCFARLASPNPGEAPGWLATEEGLHPGQDIVRGLEVRFHRQLYVEGPYFFRDLAATSEADEQAAIDADQIRAGGIRYAATRA